jgi:hypothetical protein
MHVHEPVPAAAISLLPVFRPHEPLQREPGRVGVALRLGEKKAPQCGA